jgi:hypothetical protein
MVGITKTDAMIELENSIILPVEEKEENEDNDAVKEETPKTSEKGESDAN